MWSIEATAIGTVGSAQPTHASEEGWVDPEDQPHVLVAQAQQPHRPHVLPPEADHREVACGLQVEDNHGPSLRSSCRPRPSSRLL